MIVRLKVRENTYLAFGLRFKTEMVRTGERGVEKQRVCLREESWLRELEEQRIGVKEGIL